MFNIIMLLKKGLGWVGHWVVKSYTQSYFKNGFLFSWKAQGLFRHPNGINAIVDFECQWIVWSICVVKEQTSYHM